MKKLDFFRGWTPEMIEAVNVSRESRIRKIREGLRRYYSDPNNKDIQEECNRRRSESLRRTLGKLTPGEMEGRMRNSCRSPEGLRRAKESSSFKDPKVQEGLTERRRKRFSGMTDGEKKEWVDRSFHSEEGKRNQKRFFAEESEEAKQERLRKTFLSPEGILNSKRNANLSPSEPEGFLWGWLDSLQPREWLYNGDGRQGVIVGRKIPDFIHSDGKRLVIEVLGGLGWWHTEDEVEPLKVHYKRHGYGCIVFLEYECYIEEDVVRKLAEVI